MNTCIVPHLLHKLKKATFRQTSRAPLEPTDGPICRKPVNTNRDEAQGGMLVRCIRLTFCRKLSSRIASFFTTLSVYRGCCCVKWSNLHFSFATFTLRALILHACAIPEVRFDLRVAVQNIDSATVCPEG